MEIAEILRVLERNTGTFPGYAFEAAIERREEITPELLQTLEQTLDRAEEIAPEDKQGAYFAHLYAMYLLAQFRESRAYPLIVRFARLDEATLDALCGDFVTEDMCRVLASVCNGDTRLIEELIEDPNVYEYARSAALRSLLVLVAEGDKSRDEVMAYYKSLFEGKLERSYSHAWDSLVACAVRLHPGEVADHIALAFEEGLVSSFFISPNNVEKALGQEKESVLDNLPNVGGGAISRMRPTECLRGPASSNRNARRAA